MKVAIAQINYTIGDIEGNTSLILSSIEQAKHDHADLVVFAELAVCGYPARDLLEFTSFVKQCNDAISTIAKACTGITVIVGSPSFNEDKAGKPLRNSAYILSEGEIEFIQHKTLIPNYDIFDEYRYFEPNTVASTFRFKGQTIALVICEDIWYNDNDPLYQHCPLEQMKSDDPDLIIHIAASPFAHEFAQKRIDTISNKAKKYSCPIISVNHVGAQTDILFDGASLMVDANGNQLFQCNRFASDFRIIDLDEINSEEITEIDKYDMIYAGLVMGIKDYFGKLNFKSAILGLSGGVDSALVAVLLVDALGKENVTSVMLPSIYSSEGSVVDAEELINNIDCKSESISIKAVVDAVGNTLKGQFEGTESGIAEENIQARSRALLLMAMSNKFGHVLVNTSNKSESAVGYGTLYGDMSGGLSAIGDLYKTEVFELCEYINRDKEIIPRNIINKPPSAELRPDQQDSDSLPGYVVLDKILYNYIEKQKGPAEISALGIDAKLVAEILSLVNRNEHKRYQSPPVLRVSNRAFGLGRRMPIAGKFL